MSTVSYGSLTPLRFLERSAEVYPDKVAIVHGDRRTSYHDFASEADDLCHQSSEFCDSNVLAKANVDELCV